MRVYMLYNRQVDFPVAVFEDKQIAEEAEHDLNIKNPRAWYVRDYGVSSGYQL